MNVEQLNFLLRDLADEGLLRKDDKVLIITPPNGFGGVIPLNKNEIEVVLDSELERKSLIPNGSYDFVFISSSVVDAKFIDRILKIDGIVALPLDTNLSNAFEHKPNFRVAYLRRYSSIIVALRKTSPESSSPKRKLFQWEIEAKKVALKGLEDVLLEPPKQSLVKSRKYLKKIKYLPDLMGDSSLEGYERRIFIGVGLPEENKHSIEWFKKNYPKNRNFEIHSLRIEPEEKLVPKTDVPDWLSKHLKEEEFVVMKAEAEVVEEMIRKRTISLVDELFLECKNDWWKSGKKKIGRAYWECLALYGRLRDEGVAVHQWWG
ncbi:putative transmembrane protein [Senna tora]|uniref:Putative transmembrane protein n=1 Tax=Senna tora TaxID=362788 RepID=A0A834XD57_9FABA|nr:putative transmembrane protein [Senna tora]